MPVVLYLDVCQIMRLESGNGDFQAFMQQVADLAGYNVIDGDNMPQNLDLKCYRNKIFIQGTCYL